MGLMSGQFRLVGHAYFLEVGMEGKGTVKVGGGASQVSHRSLFFKITACRFWNKDLI